MRIVLTGGGTCGHIMPNIALLPELNKYFDSIAYIGAKDSMEERIAGEHEIPFYSTVTVKLERTKLWRNAKIPYVLLRAVSEAKEILRILKPDVVFSKGGYVSLPTCLAARSMNIPYVIHESDTSLGVANRVTAGNASKIILSEPDTRYVGDRYITIGNPIREEIINGSKSNLNIRIDPSRRCIMVVGGSSGAAAINKIIEETADIITKTYNLIHIHGKNYTPTHKSPRYFPFSFVDNIGDFYDLADIIISRAGAGAIAEINAIGRRTIYIPLPKGNSRGDQEENARAEAAKNRAVVLNQNNLTPDKLINAVKDVELMPIPRPTYDRDTAARITDAILSVIPNLNMKMRKTR